MMRTGLGFNCVLLALACSGCGSKDGLSVSGTVFLDGKPLPRAAVMFFPEGETPGLGGSAETNQEGKYLLAPSRGNGISAGKYRVVVSRRLNPDGSVPDPKIPPIESPASETLPPHYSDRDASKLQATVAQDQTVHDFKLTKHK